MTSWLVLLVRLPAQPSRHRVAVWRELRRAGALSLGQGAWALPDVPAVAEGLRKARELAARGDGEIVALAANGHTATDAGRMRELFNADRDEEWREFLTECDRYDAEIDKEIRTEKFTVAELEEEEQSLERLRRWHRDIAVRDVFGSPAGASASERLAACAARLEEFTDRVFAAIHQL